MLNLSTERVMKTCLTSQWYRWRIKLSPAMIAWRGLTVWITGTLARTTLIIRILSALMVSHYYSTFIQTFLLSKPWKVRFLKWRGKTVFWVRYFLWEEKILLPEKVLNRFPKSWLSGYHGNSSKPAKRFSIAFFVQTTHAHSSFKDFFQTVSEL